MSVCAVLLAVGFSVCGIWICRENGTCVHVYMCVCVCVFVSVYLVLLAYVIWSKVSRRAVVRLYPLRSGVCLCLLYNCVCVCVCVWVVCVGEGCVSTVDLCPTVSVHSTVVCVCVCATVVCSCVCLYLFYSPVMCVC